MSGRLARFGVLAMIARRSLRQHALSTAVTALSAALAVGLVMSVFTVSSQTRRAFAGDPAGFDAVLGARGSALQLVLNAVFHLETSPGNLPWETYEELRDDPRVELALPYAVGDTFEGFRVVGTTTDVFTRFEYERGRTFELFPGGRPFDPERREAVIGSGVAGATGLRVGSTFRPFHGEAETEDAHHEEEYVVVGVLRPTSSPADRVLWIPIEGVFRMGGHVLRGAGENYVAHGDEEIPDEHKEVSAVLLKFRSPQLGFTLDQKINKEGREATLAWPIGKTVAELFDKLGWATRILELVAYLVCFVAAGSILASLYNSMKERRRELAILRSLGARRRTVFGIIVLESCAIASLGAVLGFVVHAALMAAAAYFVRRETGVLLDVAAFHPALVLAPIGMIAAGAVAGIVPALEAYSTDVAANLVPTT